MSMQRGVFVRQDLLTLERGVVVRYELAGTGFNILASRQGVQVLGSSPIFPPGAMPVIGAMLRRAWLQAEKLGSTAIGEKQQTIPEDDFNLDAATASPDPLPGPGDPASPAPHREPGRIILMSGGGN